MIYLASPYSDPDQTVREQRFHAAVRATAELIRQGEAVFSPIVHGHPLTKLGLPGDWSFWRAIDLAFLAACREVVVVMLPGWDESVGVLAEIGAAEAAGKPVRYLVVGSPTLAHVATEAQP